MAPAKRPSSLQTGPTIYHTNSIIHECDDSDPDDPHQVFSHTGSPHCSHTMHISHLWLLDEACREIDPFENSLHLDNHLYLYRDDLFELDNQYLSYLPYRHPVVQSPPHSYSMNRPKHWLTTQT